MATVLVVDDSGVDRNLVGGLLRKDASLQVEFAVNGADALAKLAEMPPDVVVTDLIMPEVDGLRLVATIHQQYPLTPVILMTSKGSEELATQALEQGAISYVPKRILAKRLLDTVRNVLAIASRQKGHVRLMGSMTRSDTTFELENDAALIGPLVSYVQQDCLHMGLCDASGGSRIGMALEEALANALYHGNLEADAALREHDDTAYWDLVHARLKEPPYCDRRIHVRSILTHDEATFVVRDEGPGFDPSVLPDPTDPANLERSTGRGILLIRTFMDEVTYSETGNTVTLVKHWGKR
jgi:CheY-like chemotaxis protein